ncbi:MAG: NADH-quinone oxidoreductase subunit M [Puniceicoccales bacterium]|jgi:NADH-quinone oxidoreductase subunit M|nr:NADH-quinone oxidoreductase subunit M [Puniceicoccales bacterium]
MSSLPWTIYLSFLGAAAALAAGKRSARAARWVALAFALAGLGATALAAFSFVPGAAPQVLVDVPWLSLLPAVDPSLAGDAGAPRVFARYLLAADGISMTLALLTGVAAVAGILFSWNIERRAGDFFALFLALIGGVYGVFLSADALLLFVFYEIAIVPKYFLVAIWGSTNRQYGAMKLVLYSFAGSAAVLAGLVWAFAATGAADFSFASLAAAAASAKLAPAAAVPILALLFFGFATLAGMFPLHTWAPTGHVAAPTGASMLLAGVVMKLGAYGCLRSAALFPDAFPAIQPVVAALALAGIVYAGLIALKQTDFKFVIGYSSVSHMGFVLLGLAAATPRALAGSVLQMFSHGVVAGLLFAVVGRMVYERTHTRDLRALSTLPLHRHLPFAAVVFVLAGVASMGFPGFSGFPAELLILTGAWEHSKLWAVAAAVGIPVAAAFTLRAVSLAFFGKGSGSEAGTAAGATGAGAAAPVLELHEPLPPITLAEKAGAGLLLTVSVVIGLRPDLLLQWIEPALNSPLFQALATAANK